MTELSPSLNQAIYEDRNPMYVLYLIGEGLTAAHWAHDYPLGWDTQADYDSYKMLSSMSVAIGKELKLTPFD